MSLATFALRAACVIGHLAALTSLQVAAQSGQTPASTPTPAPTSLPTAAELDRLAQRYRDHWEQHPHGQWLLRILPHRLAPSSLPDADSEAARLTARYCIQCHALPNRAMHGAAQWARIVDRMLPRMQGDGNQGRLMKEMMQGLAAPDDAETRQIKTYLARHGQQPLPNEAEMPYNGNRFAPVRVPGRPALSADLVTESGLMFRAACGQCHALPDPARHTAAEWPAVMNRMQQNMAWMNRVDSSLAARQDPREPRLEPERIIDFLQAHARDVPDPGPR